MIHPEGEKTDERFVPASPERVKVALLKALPAFAAEVTEGKGTQVEAEVYFDAPIRESIDQAERDAGIHDKCDKLPEGKFTIDISEANQGGVVGSQLHIEFGRHPSFCGAHRGNLARPLADETVCLLNLISTNDPSANPRGLALDNPGAPRAVVLPDATPLKVLLRDYLFSGNLKKHSVGKIIQFEVAEDLVVSGTTLVRRGALATGHFTDVTKAKGYGRNGKVTFVFDKVTAVDGQDIPITDEEQKLKGGRTDETVAVALMFPALGGLVTGVNVFVPAGTAYEVSTSGQHTVQSGR